MRRLPRETETPLLPSGETPDAQGETRAQLIVYLIQVALAAPDIPSAVLPALEVLVTRTVATGSAYAQVVGKRLKVRAASGGVPEAQRAELILERGLSLSTPFVQGLAQAGAPLFVGDTARSADTMRLSRSGVASLAAAPVQSRDGKLLGAFLIYTSESQLWNDSERDLFTAVTGTLGTLVARLLAEEDAIRALGVAVESRDPEVKGHIDRVTTLAERVGRAMGLDAAALGAIRRGAYLHDLGKVGTPDAILHKPSWLDDDERQVMQQHVEAGHLVAQQLAFLPQAALDIVLHHHERWDGQGYPHGLKGEAIPLTARIFAVCDVYDALTSQRPYKPAWSRAEAVAEIRAQAGKQFDPDVVAAFLRLVGAGSLTPVSDGRASDGF